MMTTETSRRLRDATRACARTVLFTWRTARRWCVGARSVPCTHGQFLETRRTEPMIQNQTHRRQARTKRFDAFVPCSEHPNGKGGRGRAGAPTREPEAQDGAVLQGPGSPFRPIAVFAYPNIRARGRQRPTSVRGRAGPRAAGDLAELDLVRNSDEHDACRVVAKPARRARHVCGMRPELRGHVVVPPSPSSASCLGCFWACVSCRRRARSN